MNKQEALEVALTKMRGWEEPNEEVQRQPDEYVFCQMREGVEWLVARANGRPIGNRAKPEPVVQEMLARIAAAALYLLVDEVEIVAGRTLDQWLASKEVSGIELGRLMAGGASGTYLIYDPKGGARS